MIGVAVYLVIGMVLFLPMGFLAGFLQHKNELEREKEERERPFSRSGEKNEP